MALEIEAVYENGVLRLERELPLENGQRVRISIQPPGNLVAKTCGLLKWNRSPEELDQLMEELRDDFLEGHDG